MIEINQISKTFDTVRAVDNVSFSVASATICGLLGQNGAGKTTLFKMLMGLIEPDAGQLRIANNPITITATAYKRKIGYVPEKPILYEYLTGLEYLQFVAAARGHSPNIADQIVHWLHFFNLEPKAGELIKHLSHGMRRKLSISAALLGNPEILLLDEATNGLDPESSFRFKNYLRDFCNRGGTVLFSTHIIEVVEHLCDCIVILHQGRVLRQMQQSDWQELRQHGSSLEQAFIQMVKET